MEKEMINVNDIAYAVKRDGSVINNFGDADENNFNTSIIVVIEPICYAQYNILKALIDKKGKSSKEFCLASIGMLAHYGPSHRALNEYLIEVSGLAKKTEEE